MAIEKDDNIKIVVDLPIEISQVEVLLNERIQNSGKITPQLVLSQDVKKPSAYKKFNLMEQKDKFRKNLCDKLFQKWKDLYSEEEALNFIKKFENMALSIAEIGAITFGDLINKGDFIKLVHAYNEILNSHGNKTWLHSYVNLGNHPNFLTNSEFKNAFLHPLLILLISYQVGGAVRIVDARAKDAEPLEIKAQDNMLHIDNTPFNDEYKVLLLWEKAKASGPKGQNFVIIPGTHQGARDCFIKEELAWSTENASIFITPEDVQKVFDLQKNVLHNQQPQVIEISHDSKPLTNVFAAGSLVHHRYRTEEGISRSSMIIAFHRIDDNPGQFIKKDYLTGDNDPLNDFLFGCSTKSNNEDFIEKIAEKANVIAEKLEDISRNNTEVIAYRSFALEGDRFDKWKKHVTDAPTVEQKKIKEMLFPLGKKLKRNSFIKLLAQCMKFDKHGPLDLILYEDAHEEIRKWARNRIREMKPEQLEIRLKEWEPNFTQPEIQDLLSISSLQEIASDLSFYIDKIPLNIKETSKLPTGETILSQDAYRSLSQLFKDLGETIGRCVTRQAFVSTCLFLFWGCDELKRLIGNESDLYLNEVGNKLLLNYSAVSFLIQKQIQYKPNEKEIKYYKQNNSALFYAENKNNLLKENNDNSNEKGQNAKSNENTALSFYG